MNRYSWPAPLPDLSNVEDWSRANNRWVKLNASLLGCILVALCAVVVFLCKIYLALTFVWPIP